MNILTWLFRYGVITSAGMAEVAALIGTDTTGSGTAFDYVAIGTGTNNALVTDTTLQTETQREAGVGTRVTTTYTNDTFQLVYDSFSFGGDFSITEVGCLNAASVGVLLSRGTFEAVPVTASDTLKITLKYKIVQGS